MQIEQVRSFVQEVVNHAEMYVVTTNNYMPTLKAWLDGQTFTHRELLAAADMPQNYGHSFKSDVALLACKEVLNGLYQIVRYQVPEYADGSFGIARRAMDDK